MREIKFRAWNERQKKMVYGPTDDVVNPSWVLAMCSANSLEPMQYTGLKDRNGKEVYEGDIIKCSRGCPHKVEWVQDYAGTYFGGMPAFYLSGLKDGYAWTNEEEVVGNIYENPNLLEE